MTFLRDVLLENLRIGRLRKAEVHQFVEQLVDDDEIVPHGFFLKVAEVLAEHAHASVEKGENHGDVGIDLRRARH